MNIISTISLLAALLVSLRITNGQDIGSEICSCSPSSYQFKLDFSLVCPPVNITESNAVQATYCLASPFGNQGVQDLVPVAIENIDILELGQSLRVIAQTKIDDELVDGDTFIYQSAFATPEDVDELTEQVVRALQVNMVGINSGGDRIISVFIVTFTNGCGSYPVFESGQSAGWTRFLDFGPASPELCAAAPRSVETEAPTQAPEPKTNNPTTKATTSAPVVVETSVVVEPPTDSSVLLPEDTAFTDFMSMSMSMSMPMTLDGILENLASMEFSSWNDLRGGNDNLVQGRFSEGGRRDKIRFRDGHERFGMVGSR
mmetsp:Transcript_8567/g.18703  ORF Transcript_8567/g.18703 Transcript_8567/m.18703 type:complete len:316 (+) Transcript_8567:141-1088(+)